MVRFALKNSKKSVLALIGVAALSLTMAAPAFAADDTTATVTGGTLTMTNPAAADFAGKNVTGEAQTTTASLAIFSVSDLTGSGEGWTVTAQASQFDSGPHELALGSLSMSQPTVDGSTTSSPDPTIAAGPYVIDDGSAIEIANADANEGMGVYDFSATSLTLSLPADVYAGAYTSTVTLSVISAP